MPRSDSRPTRRGRLAHLVGAGLLAGAWTAGCSNPRPLVFCHNANCAQPTDPSHDDTLEALQASLALRYRDRPVIDGVEMDLFWNGQANNGAGRCELAHELMSTPQAGADEAARILADNLRQYSVVSWNGQWFYLQMELKPYVGSYGTKHTPEQAIAHVECALDVVDTLESAATESDHRIEFIMDSGEPQLLWTLRQRPRWLAKSNSPSRSYRTAADFLDATPSGFALQYLSDFPPVTDVVFHADWISDGHYQAFLSMGLDLTLWMFSANDEALGAIRKFQPRAVMSYEALFMRLWEER